MPYDLSPTQGYGLSRTARETSREIARAHSRGTVAAARIEAESFATHIALHHAAMLSSVESRLAEQTPHGAARYQAIVDTFTGAACTEIAAISHRR